MLSDGNSRSHKGAVPKCGVTPTALVFIRVVPTVVVVVTLPAAGNAAVVPTSELVRLTSPLSCTEHTVRINQITFGICKYIRDRNAVGFSHRTPLSVRPTRRHSRPRRRTSSERGCSAQSLCTGTRRRHKSSGLDRETISRR